MPTYVYRCPAGHEFEKFHGINERPRVKCPTCAKAATRQITGGAGLVFKGSGFYITDYGKDGKGPRKSAETPPAPAKSEAAAPAPKAKDAPAGKPSSE